MKEVLTHNADIARPSFEPGLCVLSLAQLCPTLCVPMDYSPPGSSVHGIFQQEYWSGLPCPPPGDLPNPGIYSRSPALQADSLSSESPGKHKNTGMGSHGRPGFDPSVGKIPWRRERLPTPVFLPRESHGQRSLADCIQSRGSQSQRRLK